MNNKVAPFDALTRAASKAGPVRVAVADAAQRVVMETLRDAERVGLATPLFVGDPNAIRTIAADLGWAVPQDAIIAVADDSEAAARVVALVREGKADVVMKGNLHTDIFMRALLDKDLGLRLPGQRVSHVFVVTLPGHERLLGITDAAINIAPDLTAKAQICQNAVNLFRMLGVVRPKVAVLSAVETVTADIASTLDAACLTLMSRRGQITGAEVDGPLALDNAISARAATEKGILSGVAGYADILLVPDLVSGNILAKSLEYLAGGVAAGIAIGLAAPVVLTSRADPAPARLAALAIATLMYDRSPHVEPRPGLAESSIAAAPQPEDACCPLPAGSNLQRGPVGTPPQFGEAAQ
tara:strand:+ start:5313 stop:6377 length:1065 start_codon:yes stop_codon:yes gene_type:complete